jgi:hypothetical protein
MKAKLQALLSTIGSQLADIWNRSKMFLLAIAALVIALEWEKLKEFMLVYMGQKEIQKDQKTDQKLSAQESSENTQANTLVQQAQQLPSTEQPISEDWYTKK